MSIKSTNVYFIDNISPPKLIARSIDDLERRLPQLNLLFDTATISYIKDSIQHYKTNKSLPMLKNTLKKFSIEIGMKTQENNQSGKKETITDIQIQQTCLSLFEKELKKNNPTELIIYEWLRKKNEIAMYQNIIEHKHTLKQATQFCTVKAKAIAEKEQTLMVDDDTVFSWVEEYFMSIPNKIKNDEKKDIGTMKVAPKKDKEDDKKRKGEEQLSLFDL